MNPVIALVGNPNVGKSTLFNALTGLNRRTGNFAGVTVDWEAGQWQLDKDLNAELLDLPGTYSMAAKSPDEAVVVNTLRGTQEGAPHPVAVLAIVDASNPERNLYLLSQVLEQGLPTVVALNMIDIAEERGLKIDIKTLSDNLGVTVVPVQANSRKGLQELARAMATCITDGKVPPSPDTSLDDENKQNTKAIQARYGWARRMLVDALQRPDSQVDTFSDRLDRVLTHKVWGTLLFVVVMAVVFQSIYSWAGPLMDLVDSGIGAVSDFVGNLLPEGSLKSLLVDGVIAGVGSVVIFVPQIAILFLFIAIMEGCGYMARAAFLMDRLFSKIGLSGRSFIPMFTSFACAIPGVMATRTIEDNKERLISMLVAPLMSCSARLPVYTIMIGAFIPNTQIFGFIGLQGLTLLVMYMVGITVAIPVAWLLRKWLVQGNIPAFFMELPGYKMPEWHTVFRLVWSKCKAFLVRAGTVIFAVTVVIWAAAYFPRDAAVMEKHEGLRVQARATMNGEALEEKLGEINNIEAGALVQTSWLGKTGKAVEPIFIPLGWDWRITVGALASFPAREVIVATLGTIFNLGADEDAQSQSLSERLKSATWPDGRPLFNAAVALSVMIFFALCAQCGATLAVIKKESGSWKWAGFTFVYMTGLAYIASFVVYQTAIRVIT